MSSPAICRFQLRFESPELHGEDRFWLADFLPDAPPSLRIGVIEQSIHRVAVSKENSRQYFGPQKYLPAPHAPSSAASVASPKSKLGVGDPLP